MTPLPKLVAILNVTPDSFSGGIELTPDAIIAKANQLIEDGADVLDVGAESTRPGATPLSAQAEWTRLEGVWDELAVLCRDRDVKLSLDTRHAGTAAKALSIGVDWINDVSGFRDAAMLDAIKDQACQLVVMHSLSVPAQKGEAVQTDDIATFMRGWIAETLQRLGEAGIAGERVMVDPGIGFGKSAAQSWQLLSDMDAWRGDAAVLIGHSRKSFLSLVTDAPAAGRDEVTRAVSAMVALQGAEYLRVHDVAGHRAMLEEL